MINYLHCFGVVLVWVFTPKRSDRAVHSGGWFGCEKGWATGLMAAGLKVRAG